MREKGKMIKESKLKLKTKCSCVTMGRVVKFYECLLRFKEMVNGDVYSCGSYVKYVYLWVRLLKVGRLSGS